MYHQKCQLCLSEKLLIMQHASDPSIQLLNSKSEIMSKCRHNTKFKLSRVQQLHKNVPLTIKFYNYIVSTFFIWSIILLQTLNFTTSIFQFTLNINAPSFINSINVMNGMTISVKSHLTICSAMKYVQCKFLDK